MNLEEVRFHPTSRAWADDVPRFPSSSQSPEVHDTTQERIFDYIAAHPGVHLREICRQLCLAMGDVQYHIAKLEKGGKISSVRRGLYKFFYPASLFGEKQRDILSVLSFETPRELLLNIIDKPDSNQEQLANATGVSQPTVSWHLKRLVDLGILEKQVSGRTISYTLVGQSASDIAAFVRSYHPTVWESWSSRLADIFIAYSGERDDK